MPVADDWSIDYTNKIVQHVDGVLNFDGRTAGTSPSVGTYVVGATSGAIGKVIGGDTGVTTATGSLDLTNVLGQFADGEEIDLLSEVPFDTVANGGFSVGQTIDDGATASGDVEFIEYNLGATAGEGTAYCSNFTAGFANNDNVEVGATVVALVNGSEVDNSADTWDADVNQPNGGLSVPGTSQTNDSIILHYDAGTIAIPEDAKVSGGTSGAEGFAQQVVGSTTAGSIRLVDYNSTGGTWSDGEAIDIEDVVLYNAQVAGEVFQVNDIVEGGTSGEQFRVLAIIDDGDSTGKLISAGKTGALTLNEDLNVVRRGGNPQTANKVAQCESTATTTLDAADVNIPDGVRTEQRATQGGIYGSTVSLNIVRSFNQLFTYLQDTFDELGQMDDKVAMTANVKDQVYIGANGWQIPDLSFRFLEKGSYADETSDNVFTNAQSLAQADTIGDWGYYYDASNPTPQPNIYVEQNGSVLRQDWLEGQINVLVKVKTNTDTTIVDDTVPGLGQLIDGGTITVFMREYGQTYDHFSTTTVGGVAPIPLSTATDANNTTGTHRYDYTGGSGMPFTIGEEIIGTTSGAIGIVTASDSGATGNVDYILKTSTQFSNTETITGQVSGDTATTGSTNTSLVAGYGTDIRIMTVDLETTGGTTASGPFVIGEAVSQAVTGATGWILEDDAGDLYIQEDNGTAFSGSNQITGATSGATNTPTGYTDPQTLVPKDIEDGSGDKNYKAVISANITDASAQTIAEVYEWAKYVTRSESTTLQGGPGSEVGVQGRIYIELATSYKEVKASPYGSFAGGTMFGAQGVFIDKDTLVPADLQKIQLTDDLGDVYNPPNLQVLEVTNLVAPDTVAVYRSTGAASTTILRGEFLVGAVGTNNQAADSVIEVKTGGARSVSPLPSDVPNTGVLRVLDPNDTGLYLRFPYTSVDRTNNTFTLGATIGSVTGSVDLTEGDNVHVVFIEEDAATTSANNTVQYVSDIPLVVVVREKGILPFETTASFGTTGASVGAVRTADTIVNLP